MGHGHLTGSGCCAPLSAQLSSRSLPQDALIRPHSRCPGASRNSTTRSPPRPPCLPRVPRTVGTPTWRRRSRNGIFPRPASGRSSSRSQRGWKSPRRSTPPTRRPSGEISARPVARGPPACSSTPSPRPGCMTTCRLVTSLPGPSTHMRRACPSGRARRFGCSFSACATIRTTNGPGWPAAG